MLIHSSDFNGAGALFSSRYEAEWQELEAALQAMPLYVKDSGQEGKLGGLVFDPIAANAYLKNALAPKGWTTDPPIPGPYDPMGLGVDFAKVGIVGETQFAHYGLLLNNILRCEFFSKARVALADQPADVLVVITKAAMFPAANSSLYYEQAAGQCGLLEKVQAFDIPTRLVGLFAPTKVLVPAIHTTYGGRTSRTIGQQTQIRCTLSPGAKARCKLDRHP